MYVFGEYELDTQLYELRHAGRPTKIEPKVFDVLAYLIQYRDRVVLRQELLEQLWPKQFVGEAVLSYCIMAARKAVGDSGRTQRQLPGHRLGALSDRAPPASESRHRLGAHEQPIDW